MGDGDGLKCWHSHRKWKQQLARWTQIADFQKCVTKKKLMNPKTFWLCPKIEYFGISVPFCYYSLLGRVMDFPSRVRVVKKIPSTGRVTSTRHSLVMGVTMMATMIMQEKLRKWMVLNLFHHLTPPPSSLPAGWVPRAPKGSSQPRAPIFPCSHISLVTETFLLNDNPHPMPSSPIFQGPRHCFLKRLVFKIALANSFLTTTSHFCMLLKL